MKLDFVLVTAVAYVVYLLQLYDYHVRHSGWSLLIAALIMSVWYGHVLLDRRQSH